MPGLNDAHWPLPRRLRAPEMENRARAELARHRAELAKLRDPEFLRSVSLNKFGMIVENGLHQQLHNFYRGNPVCSREAKAQGFCDDLLPLESSPLNKYFWPIHGLIDNLLADWLHANNHDTIARSCAGKTRCYQWQEVWVSDPP